MCKLYKAIGVNYFSHRNYIDLVSNDSDTASSPPTSPAVSTSSNENNQ